jgi:hypothetical protein
MQKEIREVQNPAFLAVGSRGDVMIWRQFSGKVRAYSDPSVVFKIGTPGMADSCMGVEVTITPEMVGKRVAILCQPEFKTAKGKQSAEQKKWEKAVRSIGGVYAVIRSPADLVALIEKVQRGQW